MGAIEEQRIINRMPRQKYSLEEFGLCISELKSKLGKRYEKVFAQGIKMSEEQVIALCANYQFEEMSIT